MLTVQWWWGVADLPRTQELCESALEPDPGVCSALGMQIINDIQLATQIQMTGKPNVYGARIPVHSSWNFQLLDALAFSVEDREVVSFLKFGWPLNREMDVPLTCSFYNHKGAMEFEDAVDTYLERELNHNALIGPLDTVPWQG